MVNPGAFSGSRKAFLLSNIPAYIAAVNRNVAAEFLLNLQRRYLKRYPPTLPHEEEPSAELLAQIDDDAPDTEMDLTQYSTEKQEEIAKLLKFRKDVCLFLSKSRLMWSTVADDTRAHTADQTVHGVSVC